MSIYAMKPTFTDFNGYKEWRKAWKSVYRDLTIRIRTKKHKIKNLHRAGIGGDTMARNIKELNGMRVAAFKLNTILNEAKIRMANITAMHKDLQTHQASFPLTIEGCRTIEFHFNKKHLEFSTVPMWVVKTKGQTFYVHHVEANAHWSTRENPDHPSTKGSIRFRNCDLHIDKEGVATITETAMTEVD